MDEFCNHNENAFPESDTLKDSWPWENSTSHSKYDPAIKWPKISIVTPSFNQGKFIETTIRSVLLQNYPNLEYIIIDGGSTDETVEIIKKYEPWLTYWVSEPDKGQSHAVNKGLAKCTGEIFNWLNSDDWYLPDALFKVASQFINNPSAKVVSGFEYHVYENGVFEINKGTFLAHSLEATIELCQIAQPSTFFKLSVIREIGPVPEDLHYVMDGEMWVRFLLLYGTAHFSKFPHPLVNFRLHEGSKTVNEKVGNFFLLERSSIITDLQRFAGLPSEVIWFWKSSIYRTPQVIKLNRGWKMNEMLITKKRLRSYFLKEYVNQHFHKKNLVQARWGIRQLLADSALDYFMFKSIIKLVIRAIS